MMDPSNEWPKSTTVPYSDESSLNTVQVCIPRPPSSDDARRFWIVYIHGGAWRDPAILASSFDATRKALLASPSSDAIAAYASINYRLSPYPSHPTHPSNPSDPARNAKHPDHINDVLAALLFLQETYGFEDRYILVGHSCGATLALQAAMKRYWGSQYESTFALELNVVPPAAIVGVAGIYDVPAFVENHREIPVYRELVRNAFGERDWAGVSPTHADFDESWPEGALVVLARSRDDTLVESQQVDLERESLERQGWSEGGLRMVKTFEVRGAHDEIWETGEAAKAIGFALRELWSSHSQAE